MDENTGYCGINHHKIELVEKPGERAHLVYKEDVSKNHQGGLKTRKVKPKIVIHHANLENPIIRLYKLYNSLCPSNRPLNSYYLQPLRIPTKDQWYSTTPVGHTKLVGRMCKKAGIVGYYTNHSLRATAATRLQHHNIEEQQIMERTGHRSAEAVRSYKRTSNHQQEIASGILNNEKRHCGNSMTEGGHICANQLSTNAEMHHVSLECSSNNTPVFNISNCSSVSINITK